MFCFVLSLSCSRSIQLFGRHLLALLGCQSKKVGGVSCQTILPVSPSHAVGYNRHSQQADRPHTHGTALRLENQNKPVGRLARTLHLCVLDRKKKKIHIYITIPLLFYFLTIRTRAEFCRRPLFFVFSIWDVTVSAEFALSVDVTHFPLDRPLLRLLPPPE